MDRNAKRFAAAVLMPGAQLVAEAQGTYPQLVRAVGFANVQAIKKQLAFLLAKRFEVSQQSMTIRLTEWPMRVYERVEAAWKPQYAISSTFWNDAARPTGPKQAA